MAVGSEARTARRSFLDHPSGLITLFMTELWERFSYYGMRAVLLYYLYDRVSNGGLGLPTALATSIVSVYGAAVYMSGVLGGWLADRVLGSRRSIFYGGILIMAGHVVLAVPGGLPMLFGSMALIVLGTGMLKTNASAVLGDLYEANDVRRDAGFSLFYMGINLGAFIAPYVVGTLGQQVDYHLGFAVAAVGMGIGLTQYYFGSRKLGQAGLNPPNPLLADQWRGLAVRVLLGLAAVVAVTLIFFRITGFAIDGIVDLVSVFAVLVPIVYFSMMLRGNRIDATERSRIYAYIPLFLASVAFWIVDEQGSTVLATFADQRIDRHVLGFDIPASWFQSINPISTMLWAPLLAAVWMRLGHRQPRTPTKFALGLGLAGVSFLIMAVPGLLYGTEQPANPFWMVASVVVLIAGAICLSPTGLSVTTKLAPRAFSAQMMSLWLVSNSVAQGINAQLVKLYDANTEVAYFAAHGLGELVLAATLLGIGGWIHRRMTGID